MNASRPHPVVLCFSGHDPCGGAGLQADIETISAHHAHALSIPTCLTVQNTRQVKRVEPLSSSLMEDTFHCLLEDFSIDAIKIGLLPDRSTLATVVALLETLPDIPVVCDPVLRSGSGHDLNSAELPTLFCEKLLPLCRVITPNQYELKKLSGLSDIEQAADKLLQSGCPSVLVTGADAAGDEVIHHLFQTGKQAQLFSFERLPHHYHGSGCTLASAIAARLAGGDSLNTALDKALAYTWNSLQQAFSAGSGQRLPHRIQGNFRPS
ncbi:MAG: hydroxymethylpyrimidine/phosphomethylpyrimidine kinase [gamma proteobacterium symbiont of Bathyaustriella thionipta]|nr:hydroxymethylpyrimidine/phosphomethylpyrimidine kinase [gamma proteobacterium symbiont of Bathyaustriella thionipta]